jgi:N-acetyl-anhydromuramyl-L-alanine amidase AmpD
MQSAEYPDLRFMEPRAWGRGRDGKAVRYIVIHYTAGSERSTSAEDGAAYDQRRTDGTSTHYFVDQDSIIQCVRTADRANAARHRGNRLGIQYELCGTGQTRAQWLDAASLATLRLAAHQVARDCRKYGIPVRRLTVAETRRAWTEFPAGPRGIVGHVDCTRAYPEDGGDHTDPGADFPWDVFLGLVQDEMDGDDMTKEEMLAALSSADGQAALIKALNSEGGQAAIAGASGRGVHRQTLGASTLTIGQAIQGTSLKTAALVAAVAAIPEATVAELGDATRTVEEQAALLRAVLGDRAAEVGRLLSGAA